MLANYIKLDNLLSKSNSIETEFIFRNDTLDISFLREGTEQSFIDVYCNFLQKYKDSKIIIVNNSNLIKFKSKEESNLFFNQVRSGSRVNKKALIGMMHYPGGEKKYSEGLTPNDYLQNLENKIKDYNIIRVFNNIDSYEDSY